MRCGQFPAEPHPLLFDGGHFFGPIIQFVYLSPTVCQIWCCCSQNLKSMYMTRYSFSHHGNPKIKDFYNN